MLNRRQTLTGMVAFVAISDKSAAASLIDLTNLGKAFGYAAEAIGKFGDSIAHLASIGAQGWDAVSARKTRARLRDISARLSILSVAQNVSVISSLDEYIQEWDSITHSGAVPLGARTEKLQRDWSRLLGRLTEVMNQVTQLLTDLKNERSGLVAQSVYRDMIATLSGRVTLLQRLNETSAPTSVEEINALKKASDNYKTLAANLRKAIEAINAYIHEPAEP